MILRITCTKFIPHIKIAESLFSFKFLNTFDKNRIFNESFKLLGLPWVFCFQTKKRSKNIIVAQKYCLFKKFMK